MITNEQIKEAVEQEEGLTDEEKAIVIEKVKDILLTKLAEKISVPLVN